MGEGNQDTPLSQTKVAMGTRVSVYMWSLSPRAFGLVVRSLICIQTFRVCDVDALRVSSSQRLMD